MSGDKKGKILVVGGGIAGISSALEASEAGYEVILVEKKPYLGGRVAQFNKYFPKLCPPYCGLEINFKRLKSNPKVKVYTLSEVVSVNGEAGGYTVQIKVNPRFVNEKCVACNDCVEVCQVERDNDFNYGMDKTKGIYLPHEMAYPMRYVIDAEVCKGQECAKCADVCKYDAIDLSMEEELVEEKVSSIIYATGWNPYDAKKMDNLGFGVYENVITNVMMERLAAPNGPTDGKILRPSDKGEISSIAFVQCAGSRDENHLPYCSSICCLASLKQAAMVREQYPEADIHIFYIDLRAPSKYETFYQRFQEDPKIFFTKGKIAKITEDPSTKKLTVEGEDTLTGKKVKAEVDMVVLATGMEPTTVSEKIPADVTYDEFGFIIPDKPGIYSAGVARRPVDVARSVQSATGAALKAIQQASGGK
ncbi:MAG: CoB--CoM heterodisulfide reductase iron-sulfur subunit A family protein [Nitrospirae bacterium]|nr:MAG: CoB--CoM heterodisulfide reductase iron-sulfur subunit A family protein [Nitrospirota bacterium]